MKNAFEKMEASSARSLKNWKTIAKTIALSIALSVGISGSLRAFAASEAAAPVTVSLKNAKGEDVGTATITELKKGVKVTLDLKGLPAGEKALHFHEKGECIGPAFTTAGEHYNPRAKEHGKKAKKGAHAGDLENIEVKDDGTVKVERKAKDVTLTAGEGSLRKAGGTALVIHAKADDYKTQPSGDAGDRIACGVISAL
jgi:Cu-Zn family superoxide dismutase